MKLRGRGGRTERKSEEIGEEERGERGEGERGEERGGGEERERGEERGEAGRKGKRENRISYVALYNNVSDLCCSNREKYKSWTVSPKELFSCLALSQI